jgi:hypothetical protein
MMIEGMVVAGKWLNIVWLAREYQEQQLLIF